MLVLKILGIIFPVFAVAVAGLLYGRVRRPQMGFANQMNMEVFLPALIFWALVDKPLAFAEFRDLSIGAVAVVLGSGLLLLPLLPLLKVDYRTFLPPMMFNNSGNMGLPLALFAFGEQALQAAVVLFLIEMVLHLTVGIYMIDHHTHPGRLLRMPLILATLLGLACSLAGWQPPGWLMEPIKMMSQIAIPLMLFALGVRLNDVSLRDWRIGLAGAVLCPLSGVAVVLLLRPFLDLTPLQAALLLVFGALPPAVTNYLIAEQYRQEPERVASVVMLGNLGSLLAIPMALYFALPGLGG
ncbi:MAG TPA: AEC family transporter [Candidatus Competibacteraceae bacterium]|nr:AEC family transporter [Candidatus Competibacteraceae bacterium]